MNIAGSNKLVWDEIILIEIINIWRDPQEDGSAPDQQGSLFGGSAWQFDEASGTIFLSFILKTST